MLQTHHLRHVRHIAQDRRFIQRFLHCQDRCSRTNFASDEPVISLATDTPDDRLHPSDNTVRSRQTDPSRARPDPSRSGSAHGEFACVCRYIRHRRRTSVSSGLNRSVRVKCVFHQVWKSFSEFLWRDTNGSVTLRIHEVPDPK